MIKAMIRMRYSLDLLKAVLLNIISECSQNNCYFNDSLARDQQIVKKRPYLKSTMVVLRQWSKLLFNYRQIVSSLR